MTETDANGILAERSEGGASESSVRAALAELEEADVNYREARDAVEELGAETIEAVADATDRLTSLLDEYEGRATGTGDFKAFIEFQSALTDLVEELPDDLPRRDAFEAVEDRLDKRRVSEADFEHARELLEPATAVATRLDRLEDGRARYREARIGVQRVRDSLDDDLADLDRVADLGAAYRSLRETRDDPDAAIDGIREPIAAYNDAVRTDFDAFVHDAPARVLVDFLASLDARPLVDSRSPPPDLRTYLDANAAGEYPLPKVIEYADYSPSKLAHYVDDADALKRNVATHLMYLEQIDAEPFTVAWPPSNPRVLRWRADELVSAIDRFADTDTVRLLREVRELARTDEFSDLANAAQARETLDADALARLEDGTFSEKRDAIREQRAALTDALEQYPGR